MNIRSTNRGRCKECFSEAWQPFYTNYSNVDTRNQIREQCNADAIKRHSETSGQLYALDAKTASGTKTEIICRIHLRQLINKIANAIELSVTIHDGNINETHSAALREGINWENQSLEM